MSNLLQGSAIRFESDIRTLKGNTRTLEILQVPLLAPGNDAQKVLSIAHDISDQRRSEREKSLMAAIIEGSDDAIFSHSADLRITSWNRGAESLFGFAAHEAIGQLTIDLIVPADFRDWAKAQMDQDFAAIRDNRTVVRRTEVRVQRKDGVIIDVSMVASGFHDPSGQMLGMSVIMRDISERKAVEHEQALLAAIVASSDDAILSISLEGKLTSWNQSAERLFGFSRDEALGQPITIYIPPEIHALAQEGVQQQIASAQAGSMKVERVEAPLRKKDGTPFDASIVSYPIYDRRNGSLLGLSGIVSDITTRKRAMREQALLAAIVNASEDAIIGVSEDQKLTSWNPAAQTAYGYTSEEAIGRGLDLLLPPDEFKLAIDTISRLFQSGQTATFEMRSMRKDGSSFVSSVNVFPIRDSAGNVIAGAGIGRDITRLKEVERELREAQEYTRGLIESSIDAIVVVDPNLTITDANEQLAKLTELPKKVLIGSRFDNYFTDSTRAAAAVQKTLAEGYVINYDLVLVAAGGKEIQVSFNASLFYRAGRVFGILGVARDVTEQRATQRKLVEEQEYSRRLIECSPEALLVSDSNLVLTDMNESAARLTGYTRDELLGAGLASLFSDPDQAQALVKSSFDQGFVGNVELDLVTKSAQLVPVALNANVYTDAHGSVRGALIGFHDISEHKSFEKQRSLLASIVDSSGDAIFSEAPDLTVTSWNASAERLFGYKASEIIGRNASLLVPLDNRTELAEHVHRLGQTGKSEHFESRRIRKDGTAVYVAITESPIVDSVQKLTGISVTAHDISDRKRVDQELTKARDVAVEAARLKSEFLANMSHEIRTPLNSIIGLTGLLLDTELNPEQREFANDVRDSGEVLLTLINEILDFSKMVAGGISFEEADFELTEVIDEAAQLVAEQARVKGLPLTTLIDDDVARFLRGDATRLRQVLLNLIGNAIKFTDRGEVAVQVNKLSENPKDTVLRFEVRDTGIGIPEDKLHLLFRPFSQVDGSMTRHFGGTGLGLSIARELVERMGGTITVTSKPGVGSTFWFTARFAKQSDVERPASEQFAMLTGERVLIVDDSAASRQILSQQALSWGMEPTTAGSALEGLQMMQRAASTRPFLLALVDVMMPEMDGIEFVRKIKADPRLAATAVIFISSVGPKIDYSARLQGLDVRGWLTKPVPRSLLYNALAKVLSHPGAPAADRRPASRNGQQLPSPLVKIPQASPLKALIAEDNPINQKLTVLQLKKLGLEVDTAANGLEAVEAIMRFPYDVVLMDCQMPEMDGYQATRKFVAGRARIGIRRSSR